MSIINKIIPQNKTQVSDINKLNMQELEFLLIILKQSSLVGDQVEMFYNMVVKLQNQYLEQQEK
jgi:hypothetical protein